MNLDLFWKQVFSYTAIFVAFVGKNKILDTF